MQDKFSLDNRNFSFWERDILTTKRDFIIIGAGLVGMSTAISLREKYPKASILVLERSSIPYGASTRNAGFACFGSISEIIDDLVTLSTTEVESLINKRWNGLRLLRERVGDNHLKYNSFGGYEVFTDDQHLGYQSCIDRMEEINQLVHSAIKLNDCFKLVANPFGIKCHRSLVYNQYEGQIHPGMMMQQLKQFALKNGIEIQNGVNVKSYDVHSQGITLLTNVDQLTFNTEKLMITTNAFTRLLVDDLDLKPGRNQVMMTKPIKGLKIKGCFHYDKGYVYFRDYDNRLLIGGGRNISMDGESTDSFGLTDRIKEYLRKLVKEVILPNTAYEEQMWWSGIIATGSSKKPIVEEVSKNVYLGVRLGGMGVAMGSLIGKELAELV